ncbi:MAG: N-6 DNA methylase, partial [Candidatus Bathyarchaeia archaeon]
MSFEPLVPSGKAGENTWNSRLAEYLRKRGFESADFELQFPILRGRPRKPDVAFVDGGTHIISGKLGENKEFEAFSSAQEYQQLIGATTRLGEVFAVVYPASKRESFVLHMLATAEHERSVWRLASLDEVVGTISEVVQKRIDLLKRPVEPPDASVVRLLRQGVEVLYLYAKNAREERLKEVFGGAEFFDSVLSESLAKTDRRSVLSRAASFLFVNQLLFYCILRRETELYDEIEVTDMTSPQTIRSKYFSLVREKNYAPIFDIDVASLFDPERSKDGCLRVTRLIVELVRSVSTHDLIGKVFHEIIPLEFRKMIAAFYTNSGAGDLLAALAIHDPEARVLDPACGSGTLLVSAYKRKKSLIQGDKSAVEVHKRFVEQQLTGLDVMAFSAHLAAVQLLLQEPLEYTEHLRIGTVDSTTAYLGRTIPPFGETIREAFRQRKLTDFERGHHEVKPSEVVKAGAVALGSKSPESFILTDADVVMMNPPFTSSRRMMTDYKDELKKRFRSDDRYKRLVKGNVGYHLYFICAADKFLVESGRLALVMPFTTLVGGDFSELTRFLVSHYSIEFIVVGHGRSAFSENTMFDEILFVARKGRPLETHSTVLLLTKTSPI